MVTIKISNRTAYTFLSVVLIILMGGLVYAVAGVSHDVTELTGVCSLTHPENCPIIATGNVTYLEPAASYSYDACQPTCNAEVLFLASTASVPTCIDYQNPISKIRYNCANAAQNITLCHTDPKEFFVENSYPTYHCATRINLTLQSIGEQFVSN